VGVAGDGDDVSAVGDARGDAVGDVVDDAVARGLAPGVAASVVTLDGFARRLVRGRLTGEPGALVVDEDTVWDLASVTKLLGTTRLVARAIDEGVVHLDETPWPAWPGVTVAHALRHDGGLRAHANFFERARAAGVAGRRAGGELIRREVLATPPEAPPGERIVYSDLGFIALGALVEERRGRPLEDQIVDVVPPPASSSSSPSSSSGTTGSDGLTWIRLEDRGYHPRLPHVAPTERCPWRRRTVQGQVHDDNCYAMGGVAGHAGLFGSLRDVEAAAVDLLRAIQRPGTLRDFARASGPRGLGFDKATPGGTTGDALGPNTVGHLGFTGTSVWLDPDLRGGAAFVLLSNTVHPSRDGVVGRSRALRQAFHVAAAAMVRASSA
jgi:CubicO group peptidase (beta-lactamase class C family)